MMRMGLLPRRDAGDTERVRSLVLDKISTGFNLLFAFLAMMIDTYCSDQPAHAKMMEILDAAREEALDPADVDSVIKQIVDIFSDQPVFDPTNGTLRGLPKGKGVLHVAVERGIAPRPEQLPASFILMSGIQSVKAVCGNALATYGVSMGIDFVEDVDRLYNHLHSTEMLVETMCSNDEYLETTGGRIKSRTFLGHMRILLGYFVKYHKRPAGRDESTGDIQGEELQAESFEITVLMGRQAAQAGVDPADPDASGSESASSEPSEAPLQVPGPYPLPDEEDLATPMSDPPDEQEAAVAPIAIPQAPED